jgi:hypothetical protein
MEIPNKYVAPIMLTVALLIGGLVYMLLPSASTSPQVVLVKPNNIEIPLVSAERQRELAEIAREEAKVGGVTVSNADKERAEGYRRWSECYDRAIKRGVDPSADPECIAINRQRP